MFVKRLISTIFMFVLLTGGMVSGVSAQTNITKAQEHTAKIKEKVQKIGTGDNPKIGVELFNDKTYTGIVTAINADDFVITDTKGAAVTFKYSEVNSVESLKVSGKAKVGAGVAIGIAAGVIIFLVLALKGD